MLCKDAGEASKRALPPKLSDDIICDEPAILANADANVGMSDLDDWLIRLAGDTSKASGDSSRLKRAHSTTVKKCSTHAASYRYRYTNRPSKHVHDINHRKSFSIPNDTQQTLQGKVLGNVAKGKIP
jgi:hypothetical protein